MHGFFQFINALNIKQGFVLAGEGGFGAVFPQRRRAHSDLATAQPLVGCFKILRQCFRVEDIKNDDGHIFVWSQPQSFEAVKQALQGAELPIESSEMTMLPTNTMPINDAQQVKQLLHLMEVLEDYDDTQHVYANFDMPDEILTEYAGG